MEAASEHFEIVHVETRVRSLYPQTFAS